ncbi:MAG: class II fructose-bisphosphate aldolase [Elusimicrobiota bacterium]|nr:class II fructose-bisphosphate aldolase [Endomicrobiia bacterium]MDW8165419.1 class II fructose-bisphosphate aldolase [Elusimicrobiota bacterium]
MQEILERISDTIEYKDGEVEIKNINLLREKVIDELVWKAVFGTEEEKTFIRKLIRLIAQKLNLGPSSIYDLYVAIGKGEVGGFTVPAVNVRGLAYDTARALFRAAKKLNVGAVILEIARSEMGYTNQPPDEYTAVILAAAIKEGYDVPIFLQGDHFQVNAKKYKENPQKEIDGIRELIKNSINAGFYNIDLDTSTLVDESKPSLDEQQKENYKVAVELTEYVRSIQPKGIEVNLGGEIGEIGSKNSTEEELIAYMEGYKKLLKPGLKGITKLAIQTGTTHGGVPLPDGTVAKVKLDFDVIERLTKIAKEKYNLAGCVQHGASTLPAELFDKFPKVGTLEIHLATEFQNIVFDHPLFPSELKQQIYKYLDENCKDERKPSDTEQQFYYKTRKKAWGPFKKEVWSLPKEIKDVICEELQKKFEFLFEKLNVKNTKDIVKRYTKLVKVDVVDVVSKKEKFEGAD